MSLFEKKDNRIIGVDIGTSSIKLIELEKKQDGTHALVTYGFVDQFNRDVKTGSKEDASLIGSTIKLMYERAGCMTLHATAALPTYLVFTSLIGLPPMSKEELDSAIHWEAKKIIPLPLEEIVLDYKIINQSHQKKGGLFGSKDKGTPEDLKILITGAGQDTVQRYSEIFLQSGLSLQSLETEMFALSRSLVGNDQGEIMIVEIGAAITDIIIVEDGIPFLGRSIETGGSAMTRAIMNSLAINEKRAEQLKRDIGLTVVDETSGGGGVPQILRDTLEPIIHEVRYTMDLYKNHGVTPSNHSTGTIEKIILTGGSALMPHLAEYLAQALDIRVVIGDPWQHVHYHDDLKPLLATIGPKFSVAIGLALRET